MMVAFVVVILASRSSRLVRFRVLQLLLYVDVGIGDKFDAVGAVAAVVSNSFRTSKST